MLTGLVLAFVVGILWSFVGVFYKLIAKYDLSVFNISLAGSVFSFFITLIFITKTGAFCTGEIALPGWKYILFVLAATGINMAGSLVLQRSMVHGKSGVTWAIGQSALIIPFLSITLIFGEPWSAIKVGGTLAVILGMIVLSMRPGGKDEQLPRPLYGIVLALIAFFVLGIAQSMTSATSFFDYEDKGDLRPLLAVIGSAFVTVCGKYIMKDYGFRLNKKALIIIVLQAVQGVIATWLSYVAMDKLKSVGMNGVFYPIAVGTCIAGYSIYSVVFFKEKSNVFLVTGTAAILTGIAIYCVAAMP